VFGEEPIEELIVVKEPGKTLKSAKLFPIGQVNRTVKDRLSGKDTIDIWRLNTTLRSSLNLAVTGIQKQANVDVALLDATGRVIAASAKRSNQPETLTHIALEPGTFYVRLKLRRGSADTRYALTMSAPANQLGNSFETASVLRTATGTIDDFVGNSNPSDFLKFGTLVAGQLNLNLTGLSSDANLEVYDGSRNLLFASTNPGTANESINQQLTGISGSTYYIRVAQAPGQDTNYRLSYSFTPDTPTRTASGLQYIDLATGTGATPQTGQTVTVQYTGVLLDGTKFDSSRDRNSPFSFQIGQGEVIQGWDEGISTMRVGGRRQLIIPAALAYGSRGAGSTIPPNAALIFDVELLSIS
jgi:hypothetical protein